MQNNSLCTVFALVPSFSFAEFQSSYSADPSISVHIGTLDGLPLPHIKRCAMQRNISALVDRIAVIH
jgi:hypothetical protein